jgi:putative YhbY family RNA-binding protein
MARTLDSSRRSELRAQAHKLDPVVIIGDKGLTDEVIAEIDRSLKAHELIKVRAATDDRAARGAWLESICDRLGAHPVQEIGKILVIFRENPPEAKPRPAPERPTPKPKGNARQPSRRRPRRG